MKKYIAFLLAFALLIPLASAHAFEDINSRAVDRIVERGVIEDSTRFFPNIKITRAHFFEWVLKNVGEDVTGQRITEPFADVTDQAFAPFAARAWQLGLIPTSKQFHPGEPITKIEALEVVLRLEGATLPLTGYTLGNFKDLPRDSTQRAVAYKALQMRITRTESNEIFGVKHEMTRLETAKLLDAISLARRSEQAIFNPRSLRDNNSVARKPKQEVFDEVWEYVHRRYLYAEDINSQELMEGAIKSLVEQLDDDYSSYLTNEDLDDFLLGVGQRSFAGIGAQIGNNVDGNVMITKPITGSPAAAAGLKPGDIIVKVNGEDVLGLEVELVANLIRGDAGTVVNLEIQRGGDILTKKITREKITLNSLFPQVVDRYLVLQMDYFGFETAAQIRKAIAENPQAAKNGIILDLRENPGGLLGSAINILGEFLPTGSTAVVTKSAYSVSHQEVSGMGVAIDFPLVVLVDEYSASASEIVAGAIQDHSRAIVMGKKTFGKGTAQELIPLKDGSALKITIAKWMTPDERDIDGTGVTPDVLLDDTILRDDERVWKHAITTIQQRRWQPKNQ